MKTASYWETRQGRWYCASSVHNTATFSRETGCACRKNVSGRLVSLNYGEVAAFALDPIEKKPCIISTRVPRSFQSGLKDAIFPADSVRTGIFLKLTQRPIRLLLSD